jgi:hypothetical protein
MPRTKKEPVQGFNVFECRLCADRPQFDGKEGRTFSAHLIDVHQMDAKAKYRKQTDNHLDARDWYEWNYSWFDGDTLIALQSVRNPRTDKGYW